MTDGGDDHVLPLTDGWTVWRWFCLRGAGLPVELVDRLAGGATAEAAERLLAREAERAAAGLKLIEAAGDDRERAGKLRKRVRAAAAVAPTDGDGPRLAAAAAAWNGACSAAADAHTDAERQLTDENRRASAALRELARLPLFREALWWQSPDLLELVVEALLRQKPDATDSKTRQKEATVASYLQRYCLKNDTIGFFGPVGWGRFVDGPRCALEPGPALLERRTVYWEHWAIAALASRLAEDPDLQPHLAPRRMPSLRVEGRTLHHPVERRSELPLVHARLLEACDGERPARKLAASLVADPELGLDGEDDVYQLLDDLRAQKLVTWTLEIPSAGAHPEQTLARLLDGVAGAAGERARGALAELEAARRAVAEAAGDAEALKPRLAALRETFTHLTGAESTREHGRAYAGRTPIYEDCRRAGTLELGAPFLRELAAPLSLVLASARWYTHQIAERYREALRAVHGELAGRGRVDWFRFWERAKALFPGGAVEGSIVDGVRRQLWSRWGEILQPGDEPTGRRSSELRPRVLDAFAAPSPGWPSARHHSPDVLVAAADLAALERGDFELVLGELHTGMNTVSSLLFVKEHPTPDELVGWRERDLPAPGVAPVWSKARSRADFYSLSRHDLDLEIGEARSWRPRAQVLSSAQLELQEEGGVLSVATRDGRHRFEIIAFLEQHLIAESYAHFSLLAPRPRSPRVTIDRLVVQRARWQLAPAELAFAAAETPLDRFVGTQRLARELGLPRRVFLKVPEEEKPCYVDLHSPLFAELAARLLRRAASATITEMLPRPDQCWLTDARGQRYTCELRIAARDAARFGGS